MTTTTTTNTTTTTTTTNQVNLPKKLAFYYGWPSIVNSNECNVGNGICAFRDYDIVVLGQGLENFEHQDHQNTVRIINESNLSSTQFFGYVDATLPLDKIQDKIDDWARMGVRGIFVDNYGYDSGTNRDKQRAIVWSIHHANSIPSNTPLVAFVSADNIEDVFSPNVDAINNPNGSKSRLTSDDWYLANSFAISDGNYDDAKDDDGNLRWQNKAKQLIGYRTDNGIKIASLATAGNAEFDQNKSDYAYYAAVLNGFDAWGWGEQNFSGSNGTLPFRTRPNISSNQIRGDLTYNNGVLERSTTSGLRLDTVNHTGGAF